MSERQSCIRWWGAASKDATPWLEDLKTAKEVANYYGPLDGKVFLITGCSSGIGKECAISLAAAGGKVFMACRSGAKADSALADVRAAASSGQDAVQLLELDLGVPSSVNACSEAFLALNLPLHALINNAGINGVQEWGQFTPGVETQLATNFLGHFRLTQLLDEKLRSTEGSRVVNLSSESHRRVRERNFDISEELPPKEATYDMFHAYAFSNLCRILWTQELSTRVPYPVVSLHPGIVDGTGMLQHMTMKQKIRQIYLALAWELRPWARLMPPQAAARTQTWAAVAPVDTMRSFTGKYFSGNTGSTLGAPVEPTKLAQRSDLASAVYEFADTFFKSLPNAEN
jgi:NAD(P)-dependent dehydrogenase (short-subunit alcohol dehydrogenase family)